MQYSKDIGFTPITCRIYRPQTKGKVESANRFVQWIRPYDNELSSEDELIDAFHDVLPAGSDLIDEAYDSFKNELIRIMGRATKASSVILYTPLLKKIIFYFMLNLYLVGLSV